MMKIIGRSGSVRARLVNTGLLRAAAGMISEGTELLLKTIHSILLFDGDVETQPRFGGRLLVSHAAGPFNADGQLADEGAKEKLRAFRSGFAAYIRSLP